ncbi:MAG: nuclear transport factor 2 family protein [Candidatus Limnocylindria bacterium]
MTDDAPDRVMRELADVLKTEDWSRLADVFHPDAVLEFPQSAERFRGLANIRAQFEQYPDMDPGGSELAEVIGERRAYALSPSYTVIGVEGSGDRGTAIIRVRYPDGSLWWAVNVYELRDDRITRSRTYFAPDFEPPEWRAPYREGP